MAEVVPLDRRGGWQLRQREQEEVAIGVMGPLPRREPPYWLQGNGNHLVLTISTILEKDQATIKELLKSGKVHRIELLSWLTPVILLNQNVKIDPINGQITERINDMARGRRILLLNKLKKKNIDIAESTRVAKGLCKWPADIQELQGQIIELEGRYVRIPQILVTDIKLLP